MDNFKRSIKNVTHDVTNKEVTLANIQQACEDMINAAPTNSDPEHVTVIIPSTIKRFVIVIDTNKGSE